MILSSVYFIAMFTAKHHCCIVFLLLAVSPNLENLCLHYILKFSQLDPVAIVCYQLIKNKIITKELMMKKDLINKNKINY